MASFSKSDSRDLATRSAARAKGPGKWKRAQCEACALIAGTEDKRRSFGYHPGTRFYNCFRCGFRGRLSPQDAAELTVQWEQSPSGLDGDDMQAPHVVHAPLHFAELYAEPAWSETRYDAARAYVEVKRGIGVDLACSAGIGACAVRCCPWMPLEQRDPDAPQCASGRMVVPIFDSERTQWLGWVGRDYTGKSSLPYLYASAMDRATMLYNHEALFVDTDEPALVVEGTIDALAVAPDGVALLGKHSAWQIDALLAARRPVVVVMDGDAWVEGAMLAARLRFDGQDSGAVRLPPGRDPDQVDITWLRRDALESLVRPTW